MCSCPVSGTAVHGVDGVQRALARVVPGRVPVLPRIREDDGGVSEPYRPEGATTRRFFLAGLVIHGGFRAVDRTGVRGSL